MQGSKYLSIKRKKPLSEEAREALRLNLLDMINEFFGLNASDKNQVEVCKRIFMYYLVKYSGVEDGALLRIKLTEGNSYPSIKSYHPQPTFFSSLKRRCSVNKEAFSSFSLRRSGKESKTVSASVAKASTRTTSTVKSFFNVSSPSQYEQQHSIMQALALGQDATRQGIIRAFEANFMSGITSKSIRVPLALVFEFGMKHEKLLHRCFDDNHKE